MSTEVKRNIAQQEAQKITPQSIEDWLVSEISNVLEIDKEDVDTQVTFNRLGVDSITAVEITANLEKWLGCKIDPVVLFKYPTIEKVSPYLCKLSGNM